MIDRDFLKHVNAENLQNSAQTFVNSVNLVENGYHQVNANGDPDLGADRVLAGSVESLDAQVLLDPIKEEFDLPAPFVYGGDEDGGQFKVVRQKHQPLAGFRIHVTDTAKHVGVGSLSFFGAQADDLITPQACAFVYRAGFQNVETNVRFASDNEKGASFFNSEQTPEVEVGPIENIDAPGFKDHVVEKVNVMHRSLRDPHEYRVRARQVDLRVQFDGRFRAPECRPWKHRQTQVNGRGVHGINHFVKIQSAGISTVQSPRLADENLRRRLVNAPVPMLVRVSKRKRRTSGLDY